MKQLLLLQPRNNDDSMASHELQCIQQRFSNLNVRLSAYCVVDEPAQVSWLEHMDGILIGGSGDYSVHHPMSQRWVNPIRRVLDEALTRGLPGFGLCFGHQLLGLHLGGRVVTAPDCEEIGTVTLPVTALGQADPLFQEFGTQITCHTGHSDCVVEVPDGVDLLVTGSRTTCQAFRVRGTQFYSTQFHPDLSGTEARQRYMSNKRSADGFVSDAVQRRLDAYQENQDESNRLLRRFLENLTI